MVETSARLEAPAAEVPRRSGEDARYINRELSWLDFNERVLALAEEERRPLLERAKFAAIFSSNLDEFFQIRVSGLLEQLNAGWTAPSPDGLTATEQIDAIRVRAHELVGRIGRTFVDRLVPELTQAGICLVQWEDLSGEDREHLEVMFHERVFPVLTPLSVDPAHPFPYISDLSLNLAVVVRDKVTQLRRFARVKVPPLLPRFVNLPDGHRFIPLEQLIAANLSALFPGMEIAAHHLFRVTRDADLDIEIEEAEDLLSAIETSVRLRSRSPEVVRLEVNPSMPEAVLTLLTHELELDEADVYVVDGLLDLSGLWQLYALDRPDLKDRPWTGVTPPRFAPSANGDKADLFAALRAGDVLVHHPYDSFSSTVEAFIEQASRDHSVLALKQTLYRTSDRESPIVRSLIRAAEGGKQVVALVELQARGDEEANIGWARLMEQAGVHVLYGVVGLKTHAKISLVVREEDDAVRRYCHVGTGNYNPTTAKLYEDVGLLTAEPDLTADVADLFNYLTGYSRQSGYRNLLVAPLSFRSRILDLIRAEAAAGQDGRIILKMNSLVDVEMIDALYEASGSGTRIDLIVRGICCLRAGVPGLSETIRVRSLVGRYLEHSRIFRFGAKDKAARYLIGSADLMPRNLDRRVEATAEVKDPTLRARLQEILDINLSDDVLAWTMLPDGTYTKVPTVKGIEAHETLQELALARASGRIRGPAAVPEREVKLAAAPSFRLPDLTNAVEGAVVEDHAPHRQRTTYFDTPDLRLARWGASLRYRDTDGWTVKLPNTGPGSMLVREEIRFDGDPKQPPADAVDLLRAYVRTEKLAPVTRLRTLRRSVILRHGSGLDGTDGGGDGDGSLRQIAEVVDDEVSVMDGRRLAARFRELEVEAADDTSDEVVDRILARLRAAGAGEPDPTPKYVRAVGPRATEPPEVVVDDLQSGASGGAVIRQALAASVIRLLQHDAIIRLGTDDEGVHQARVATRRLRSDLRTFDSLLDPAWTASIVEELRWLGDRLGSARDADVLLERLTARVHLLDHVDAQAAGRLLAQLAQARDEARTELMAALREPRYAEVLDRLVEAANHPALLLEGDLPAATVLPGLVSKPWKKLRRAVRDLDDPPQDDQLHAVRIRAKRLRYASEAVAPLMGKPARALAEAAADLQEILGEHNDAVVAVRWLRGPMSNGRSVRTAFVAGELAGLEQWAAADTRDRWNAVWKRLKGRRLRARM